MKKIRLIITVFAVIVFLSACGSKNSTGTVGANRALPPSPIFMAENTKKPDMAGETSKTRAERITGEIEKLPEVERASVVITGNTAIIGIITYGEPTDSEIIDIKKSIEKKVKALDGEIDHVTVSATPELYERITNIIGNRTDAKLQSKMSERIHD